MIGDHEFAINGHISEWDWPDYWNRAEWYQCLKCGWRSPMNKDECEICHHVGSAHTQQRVFVKTIAGDVFDSSLLPGLLKLIQRTPNLTYILPIMQSEPATDVKWPANVWLGLQVKNQEELDRHAPIFQRVSATIRFLYLKPLAQAVNLYCHLSTNCLFKANYHCQTIHGIKEPTNEHWYGQLNNGVYTAYCGVCGCRFQDEYDFQWIIINGGWTSKHQTNLLWTKNIIQQYPKLPIYVEQFGKQPYIRQGDNVRLPLGTKVDFVSGSDKVKIGFINPLAASPDEWPVELRVRQFPDVK